MLGINIIKYFCMAFPVINKNVNGYLQHIMFLRTLNINYLAPDLFDLPFRFLDREALSNIRMLWNYMSSKRVTPIYNALHFQARYPNECPLFRVTFLMLSPCTYRVPSSSFRTQSL